MGMCKIDLTANSRQLSSRYRLSSPADVSSLLHDWYAVYEEALRGNFAVIDMLVDVQSEIDALSPHERDVADLVRRWSIEEVAGIVDIDELTAKARLASACEKIAREFAESEGYDV